MPAKKKNEAGESPDPIAVEAVSRAFSVVENDPDPSFVLSDKGTIFYANQAAAALTGHSRKNLLCMTVFDLDVSMVRESWTQVWNELRNSDNPIFEAVIAAKHGTTVPVEVAAGFVSIDGSTYSHAIVRDISTRKNAEDALERSNRQLRASEEYLRESEKTFRNIIESSPMGMHMYRHEDDGRLIFTGANPAADEILGIDNSQFIGKTIEEAFPPLADTDIPDSYRKVASTGEPWHNEQVQYEHDSITGAYDVNAFQTSPGRMVATFTDISERKRTQEALERSEENYRCFVESFHGIALRSDHRLTPIIGHGRIEQITGYSYHELLDPGNKKGIDWIWLVLPEHREMIKDHVERLKTQPNYEADLEYEIKRKDGSTRWVREIAFNICDETGRISHVQTAIYDITQRREAQRELMRLDAAVNEAAESIIITDPDGVIQFVNPWFEQMTGYTKKEILGKNTRVFKSGYHDEAFYEKLWSTISSGNTWRGHFTNRKKDGTIFEEDAVISPVRDRAGAIVNYVAVKRDVTQVLALDAQVRQSQKMAAIGQLAHKIAHDFVNVLVIILGNAQLAREKTKEMPEVSSHINEVINAANRVSSITAELLAFSHRGALTLKPMSLDKAITGVDTIIRETLPNDVELRIDTNAADCTVKVDPLQLEQALLHMAINSAEAMPEGGEITLSTERAKLSKAERGKLQADIHERDRHTGDFAVVSVSDTGCGMSRDVQAKMFEPFYTTKKDKQNSGLGLSTVYRIVDQHNACVTVDSRPNKGTTIRIYLPIVD